MRRTLVFLCMLGALMGRSQSDSTRTVITEKEMREAAAHIVRFSGLSGQFLVRENQEVKSAVAFVKGKQRFVEYNPEFMTGILDSSVTRWSAVSILAHEIAHHLMGHTLDPASVSVGNELECDHYSGFILEHMGATLEEAQAAMRLNANLEGSATHPPRDARLEAISRGWHHAEDLEHTALDQPFQPSDFTHRITFVGDPHAYYATRKGRLVWLDLAGHPLELGNFGEAEGSDYTFQFDWDGKRFQADSRLKIWTLTPYNVWRQVGELRKL